MAELELDALPTDTARAVAALKPYDWRSPEARATFEQLIGFQLTQDQLRYNATR